MKWLCLPALCLLIGASAKPRGPAEPSGFRECSNPYWVLQVPKSPEPDSREEGCSYSRRWTEAFPLATDRTKKTVKIGAMTVGLEPRGESVQVEFSEKIVLGQGHSREEGGPWGGLSCDDIRVEPSVKVEGRHLGYRTERYTCPLPHGAGFRRRQVFLLYDDDLKMTVFATYEFRVGFDGGPRPELSDRLERRPEPSQSVFEKTISLLKPKKAVDMRR